MGWIWLLAFLTVIGTLAYHRSSLKVWTVSVVVFLLLLTRLSRSSEVSLIIFWALAVIAFIPLYFTKLRYKYISKPILEYYRKEMPTMSRTEREALAAGTVSWEGDLFQGNPSWTKLLITPKPQLSAEEKAFLDGPVDTLCAMIDDWDITHTRMDLPPKMWKFLKDEGFFAFIVPKEYGGKQFSSYALSQILTKVYGRSATVATTIAVPNSLGPAELLAHYGTDEQKNYYLPRLASGEDVPCFALTGPDAGSDAGAMIDTGVVCWGEHEGKKVLGVRLNFNKRYITLAPVATVIGLAFKMYDPDHLIGKKEELGITCALIPRETPGITIGRRHLPANIVFQNGPIQGTDVFIPLDWIIGGVKMAGQGWRMLMESLAAGRAITLPSSAIGSAKLGVYASGAYARVRRQFGVSIGRFEGIEEVLARMSGFTYIMDATRSFTAGLIDLGARPAIASAITKYHVTELGRKASNDAMDLHGGKGICLGPKNYLVRAYEATPIAITVEGANILTRSLIIFGQGAMRCHPYIFAEFEAARKKDEKEALVDFDKALMGHIYFTLSNFVRTFALSTTSGYINQIPSGPTKRYFQQATRFSSAFALLADACVLILGGSLKRRESISGRLGDILSHLYMLSATLKHYQDQGNHAEDLPIVNWACEYLLYQIQESFDEILKNFPNRLFSGVLRFLIFPYGKNFSKPSDKLGHKVVQLILSPSKSRDRLTEGLFVTDVKGNQMSLLQDAFLKSINAEPVEKIIKTAIHDGVLHGITLSEQAKEAYAHKLITKEQLNMVLESETARYKVIAVDDFAPEELTQATVKKATHDVYSKSDSHE
ncbi:MAG: acyl-CoA dehydrogenase [Gammaproteobacteria bacterium]